MTTSLLLAAVDIILDIAHIDVVKKRAFGEQKTLPDAFG